MLSAVSNFLRAVLFLVVAFFLLLIVLPIEFLREVQFRIRKK